MVRTGQGNVIEAMKIMPRNYLSTFVLDLTFDDSINKTKQNELQVEKVAVNYITGPNKYK